MNSQSNRLANFDLLRIISMFMIVSFHCVYHGNFDYSGSFTTTHWILKEFWLLGELGVNLFMLITGYFMANGKFNLHKLIKIVVQLYCFNFVSCVLNWTIELPNGASLMDLLTPLVLPISQRVYWYITVYIMIYIFSPYINCFIKSISQKDFANLLMISFVLWSVFPTTLGWAIGVESDLHYYNRFIWCIFIYLLGAYIRLYSLSIINTKKAALTLTCACFFVASIAIPIIAFVNSRFNLSIEPAYFWHPNTVIMLFMSIGVFGLAKHTNVPNWKMISILASTTTGIYMLHDGKLRYFLWQTLFPNAQHQESPWLILYILLSALAVFILGALLDLGWQKATQKLIYKRDKISKDTWIVQKSASIASTLYQFFNIK